MRRLSASRASTAVAVVAVVVAVLAVMFPGLVFGQTTSSHGGSPSDVYTQTNPDVCLSVGVDGGLAMEQDGISFDSESNVLVYFTTRWGRLGTHEEGLISLGLDGAQTNEWNTAGNVATRVTETVMWTFDNVQPGTHQLSVFARVDPIPGGPSSGGASADLTMCAVTVFVIPVAW